MSSHGRTTNQVYTPPPSLTEPERVAQFEANLANPNPREEIYADIVHALGLRDVEEPWRTYLPAWEDTKNHCKHMLQYINDNVNNPALVADMIDQYKDYTIFHNSRPMKFWSVLSRARHYGAPGAALCVLKTFPILTKLGYRSWNYSRNRDDNYLNTHDLHTAIKAKPPTNTQVPFELVEYLFSEELDTYFPYRDKALFIRCVTELTETKRRLEPSHRAYCQQFLQLVLYRSWWRDQYIGGSDDDDANEPEDAPERTTARLMFELMPAAYFLGFASLYFQMLEFLWQQVGATGAKTWVRTRATAFIVNGPWDEYHEPPPFLSTQATVSFLDQVLRLYQRPQSLKEAQEWLLHCTPETLDTVLKYIPILEYESLLDDPKLVSMRTDIARQLTLAHIDTPGNEVRHEIWQRVTTLTQPRQLQGDEYRLLPTVLIEEIIFQQYLPMYVGYHEQFKSFVRTEIIARLRLNQATVDSAARRVYSFPGVY